MPHGIRFVAVAALMLAAAGRAAAQETEPPPTETAPALDPDPVQVHAFVSQGYIKTTDNNYLAKSEGRGSTEFAEAGINVTKAIGDRLRLGIQLFTRDLGPIGNYDARFDWFYLDYRLADYLGFRAGRVKIPFGLYNEVSDIDAARVSILLPQSVYSTLNRDYLLAQTGAELYGYLPLGAAGALDYRLYGGTISLDIAPRATVQIVEINIPYVAGGRLMWETPLLGLRLGGSAQALRLDVNVTSLPTAQMPATPGSGQVKVVLWVTSAEYIGERLVLAAEYGRWHRNITSNTPLITPNRVTQERFYVMGSYRLRPWITPGLYLSALYPDVSNREGRQSYLHALAGTVRFDITASWLFKLEVHGMHGTAELDRTLNGNAPLSALTENWLVFLAKTTLYF